MLGAEPRATGSRNSDLASAPVPAAPQISSRTVRFPGTLSHVVNSAKVTSESTESECQ